MPEQVSCPSCGAALRIPENLLGKNVKCPKCQTTFLAQTQAPAEPEEPEERIASEPPPARSSSRRREAIQEDYDEEGSAEDEDRPRRRRRGDASAAASAVAGPAIAMMVVACLDIVWGIVDLLLRILGISLIAAGGAQGKGAAGPQQSDLAGMVGGIGGDIFGACLAILILIGALKMKNLSSYGMAMTACIISIVPCHACCCLGIPFGIWGLVMLNKPEVKEAFGRNR
ncbi:MAG TPA: zinc-ribbon domain-containing protein [Gemmataceae bacterium]|jgi:predicted Zn finger-like uncharacterized protein